MNSAQAKQQEAAGNEATSGTGADGAGAEVGTEGEVRAKRRIAGEVQGVGFRAAAREAALRLGARGWARNESDGSVTVLMAGTAAAIAEMDGFLRQGPPSARVAAAAALMLDDDDEKSPLEGFQIR